MTRKICHIVDDTNPGGVSRLLDFVKTSPAMAEIADHEVRVMKGGLSIPPKIDADIIVSHMVISWRNLPFFAALRRRHPNAALVHVEHSYSAAFVAAEVPAPRRFNALMATTLSLFDRVVAISTSQRDWLASLGGISPSRIRLIRSCVDLSAFLDVAEAPTSTPKRIGAIGRLHNQKGFDILISAFRAANLDDVRLEIFGDGPERARLKELAGGDPRIIFHGHTANPARAMAAVDAVAMPSRREPYGLVALEAMAAGRPALVSRIDGLCDSVEAGAIGVANLSVDSWATALLSLCERTHTTRAARARSYAENAEARFAEGWKGLVAELV